MANELNDVFRVTATFDPKQPASEVQNIYYYQITDLVDATDPIITNEFNTLVEGLMANVAGILSTDYNGVSTRVVNVTKRERVGVTDNNFAGTDAVGEELPAQTAGEILVPLKAQGRTARKYLGPFVEGAQVDSFWGGAALAALQAFADAWDDPIVGVSGNQYTPGIARFVGVNLQDFTPFPIASGIAVDKVHTQRRRTPGRGLS